MKLAIGDIHGKDAWKQFINQDFEEFYFVGDYFDNYKETNAREQIDNFKEICEWARKDHRVKLCLGNHDFHYICGDRNETYSGFQLYMRFDIAETIENNIDIIKPIYQSDDYLISHAGITKTFLKSLNLTNPIDINKRFDYFRMSLAFSGRNQYGDDITQGPLWVRPDSLLKDKIDNYKQIVGHTRMDDITTIDNVTFIDCLDNVVKAYEF